MELGNIVEIIGSDKRGVVINDSFGCCGSDETMVVYYGTNTGMGTGTDDLKVTGQYKAVPEPKKCGAGKKADCCIFLTVGADGFCCERFSSLRDSLIFKTMSAKRNPTEPYPDCMNQSVGQ